MSDENQTTGLIMIWGVRGLAAYLFAYPALLAWTQWNNYPPYLPWHTPVGWGVVATAIAGIVVLNIWLWRLR